MSASFIRAVIVAAADEAGLKRLLKLFCRLGRRAKPVRPMPCKLVAQLLDQDCLRLQLGQKTCSY